MGRGEGAGRGRGGRGGRSPSDLCSSRHSGIITPPRSLPLPSPPAFHPTPKVPQNFLSLTSSRVPLVPAALRYFVKCSAPHLRVCLSATIVIFTRRFDNLGIFRNMPSSFKIVIGRPFILLLYPQPVYKPTAGQLVSKGSSGRKNSTLVPVFEPDIGCTRRRIASPKVSPTPT